MDTQKQQIVERLKQATNILVTVSANPSVDQLSAAIGLTLLLNKLDKHATAVFSGSVPSTIEFLQPEKTLEKNTDSLRDFIIALDKSKADKIRYKVEDQVVKIFITPYRTSITDKDLDFSQGDFNVEVVMALGVNAQQDLDQAITSHGRILHDATVVAINTHDGANLGSINWSNPAASSLCEMLLELGLELKADVLDGQMATAFLTGIVAETNRFSNEKTSSATMEMSAKLMSAGANQQLVASELQTDGQSGAGKVTTDVVDEQGNKQSKDGELDIAHGGVATNVELPQPTAEEIKIDDNGEIELPQDESNEPNAPKLGGSDSRMVMEPPAIKSQLTANAEPENLDPAVDPLSASSSAMPPLLTHDGISPPTANPLMPDNMPGQSTPAQDPSMVSPPTMSLPEIPSSSPSPATPVDNPTLSNDIASDSPADWPAEPQAPVSEIPTELLPQADEQTLTEIEKTVESPHLNTEVTQSGGTTAGEPESTDLSAARNAVNQAVNNGEGAQSLQPISALNAQPIDLNPTDSGSSMPSSAPPLDMPMTDPAQPQNSDNASSSTPELPQVSDPTAPPTVPPPLLPPLPPAS